MKRRHFLATSTTASLTVTGGLLTGCETASVTPPVTSGDNLFQHGVASGDPLADRIILWTRLSPALPAGAVELPPMDVNWWVATNRDGRNPVASGVTATSAARDFTVKVDAAGLQADTSYFYGFEAAGSRSRVGTTRTLPGDQADHVRLAVTSCANYPQGYFNAYREIASTTGLNAVLSLGDYIYEYANREYGDGTALGRISQPDHEIVSLADYRVRHAQHKAEQDLQDAHAAHPWIVVWDDHESANNSWSGGAQNHNPGEGEWSARKTAAIRAYYEWMPIREVPTGLYRNFRFGKLADLVMLDTRLEGRDEPGERDDLASANDPSRTLLGPIQEARFLEHLSNSQAQNVRWKLVGQQVVFAPWSAEGKVLNPDSWDGYRESRRRVLQHVAREGVADLVILTGDVHSAWGMEVPFGDPGDRSKNAAIELVTPAVSSVPLGSVSEQTAELVKRAEATQPHIRYADGTNNGYLIVDLTDQRARAEWYFTGARNQRSGVNELARVLECQSGTNRLGEAG